MVRWIDAGALAPLDLHATYTGLAECQPPEGAPILLWSQPATPHLCIGASQSAPAELDLLACEREGVPIIRRPLGGGTVWLDPHQYCFFVILPARAAPQRHERLFDLYLTPVLGVFRSCGLNAERVGQQDLWLGGKKILGSGAATLGTSMVFGSSFLLQFNAGAFASLIRCNSSGFAAWLQEELRAGMTDWREQGCRPSEEELQAELRRQLERACDWRFEASSLSSVEREAIAQAREELDEPLDQVGTRHVTHGIKINQHNYLLEYQDEAGLLRLVMHAGSITRIESDDATRARNQAKQPSLVLVFEQVISLINLNAMRDVAGPRLVERLVQFLARLRYRLVLRGR